MSSYVDFYIEKNGVFISLTDYSRNNPIYRVAEGYVPYGKGTKFDEKIYSYMKEGLEESIERYKKALERYEHNIEFTRKVEGISLEEKLEAVEEYRSLIEEVNEEIEITKAQLNHLNFIYHNIAEWRDANVWVGIEWDPNYKEEE